MVPDKTCPISYTAWTRAQATGVLRLRGREGEQERPRAAGAGREDSRHTGHWGVQPSTLAASSALSLAGQSGVSSTPTVFLEPGTVCDARWILNKLGFLEELQMGDLEAIAPSHESVPGCLLSRANST